MAKKSEKDENKNSPDKKRESKDDLKNEIANPQVIDEVIKNAPPDVKRFLAMSVSKHEFSSGPFSRNFFDSIGEKLRPEHITKIIDNSDVSDKRNFWHSIVMNILKALLLIVGAGVFIWLTIFFLKDLKNDALYQDILKIAISFLGGLGVGFGIKNRKSKE